MTKVEIAIIICVVGALIALLLAVIGGGGPRVTEITRRVEREEPREGE